MSQQLQITGGAKVRDLQDVIIGTSGVLSSLAFNVANGVPKLDSNGKILVSQLPNSVMEYQGTWNASTNTPTLVNGVGNQGDVYLCNVAGTTNFGAGPITFAVGDSAIYSGTIWQRAGGATGTVTSVGLSTSGNAFTIGSSPVTTSGTITINGSGTSGQYINGAGNLTTFPTLISSIGLSMPSAFSVSNSPLTANGTIAVTGAGYPSQYIRGDGTLADFPTSGGGGSSVSYYLNGGTSQGTIGGVTYYEMSKTADTGTGVDFPKSGDGLIVSFLTDAGDPAQLNIPAGNWNYEIYASMSSNGGTPQMYAELYVYNGTTFTLIATSSNEILYDGVNLNLYTFAMTVPATTLALTDRLAVKLYATNSGGKTTTVHTQDSHLCQIITTFSTGITALNGLTAQVQYFATGTTGTDFNISSSTATHTFNIPDASASARGLITTGTQTIAGGKTFSGFASFTSTSGTNTQYGIYLSKGSTPTAFSTTTVNIYSDVTTNNLVIRDNSSTANLVFNNSTQTYTFPAASGTIALTSNLSSYVPYTGATGSVDLGLFSLTSNTIKVIGDNSTYGGTLSIKQNNVTSLIGTGYTELFGKTNRLGISFGAGSIALLSNSILTAERTYTLPDASGTIALTSNIPSNIVTGTGTSGRLAYWNGTSTQTSDGNLTWDSTYSALSSPVHYALNSTKAAFNLSSNTDNVGKIQNVTATSWSLAYGTADLSFPKGTSVLTWNSSGQVGIGNTSPSYTLDVSGSGRFTGAAYFGTTSGNIGLGTTTIDTSGGLYTCVTVDSATYSRYSLQSSGVAKGRFQYDATNVSLGSQATGGKLQLFTSAAYNMEFLTNDTLRMTITSSGNVGIGYAGYSQTRLTVRGVDSSTSNYAFRVENSATSGIIEIRNDGQIGTNLGTGTVYSTGGILSVASDMTLKIEDGFIDNALEKVLKLKPRYFHWKEESKLPTDLRQLGFYAQEVNEALGEEVANTPKDEHDKWGIYDRGIIAMLTKAIQEMNTKLDAQNQTIQSLQEQINILAK